MFPYLEINTTGSPLCIFHAINPSTYFHSLRPSHCQACLNRQPTKSICVNVIVTVNRKLIKKTYDIFFIICKTSRFYTFHKQKCSANYFNTVFKIANRTHYNKLLSKLSYCYFHLCLHKLCWHKMS